MKFVRIALTTLVVALAVSAVAAQSGGLTIQVVDSTGPLPGATVTISHESGYVKETTVVTNKDGRAEFPVLRAGSGYAIQVSFPGFGARQEGPLRVSIGKSQTLTVQLAEELRETVKVIAEGEVIELEKTDSGAKFSDEFIQDLPVPGRFYQNVLTLAPGVQDADGDGNPNVHGGRDRDFKASVSGVSNVDPLTGQQMSQVNPNSIEEMEVITAGAGIEFSRAQGGFANIIQKQGSNQLEGVFEFYYRSSLLDGDGARTETSLPNPGFDTYQPSFQISGPIIKDKLWYRLSHEFIFREDPINAAGGIVVQERTQGVHSDQLTWQVSPRNKLEFQLQSDPFELTNLGVSSIVPEQSSAKLERSTQIFQVIWTAPLSPKILVQSSAAWQDLSTAFLPNDPNAVNNCVPDTPQVPDTFRNARCTNATDRTVTGPYPFSQEDQSQRLTVQTSATIYGGRFWGMSHQFKLGLIVENERYFRDLKQNPSLNVFQFTSLGQEGQEEIDSYTVILAQLAVPDTAQVRATGTVWGLYANDTIRPRQNLSIDLGLRVDREEINSNGTSIFTPADEANEYLGNAREVPTLASVFATEAFTAHEDARGFIDNLARSIEEDPDTLWNESTQLTRQSQFWEKRRSNDNINLGNTNFSPRISLAWDPWSNSKTSFSFTARRQYGSLILSHPLQELNPSTTFVTYNVRRNTETQQTDVTRNGGFSPTVNTTPVLRDLQTPYQDEFTFAFERELWAETSIAVTYINRKFRDQLQDVDNNAIPGDFGKCRKGTEVNPSSIVGSPGLSNPDDPDDPVAPWLTDPYTGVRYPDTNPGIGDGYGKNGFDDCQGELFIPNQDDTPDGGGGGGSGQNPFDDPESLIQLPDGVPDLYLQNPAWGSRYLLGNYNRIDYEGVTVQLTRRQYRSWEMQASYTWSEAQGDGEDFQQALGDDLSQIADTQGFQSYDQRHSVKVSATTITPWGFRLGGNLQWESGLPYSILDQKLAFDATPPEYGTLGAGASQRNRTTFPTGERNDQRNSSFWNLDLKLTKEMNLGRGLNLQLSAEVFNVFNDDTLRIWNGFTDSGAQINGVAGYTRRFGRQWQLGMKLAF